jgi:transposase
MPEGKHKISREIKEAALNMSRQGVSDDQIKEYLGISRQSMRRLRVTYRETGEVVRIPACPGRPHILDGLDARVGPFLFILHCTNFSS